MAVSFRPEVGRSGTKPWLWWLGLGAAVALSRFLLRAREPDGFDSINFLLGMSKGLDMAKLRPHFPGYPVYVALGALLVRLGLPALTAATAISSVAAGLAGVGLAVCADALYGPGAGVAALLLHLVAWQPWLLGGGALSDSLGVALAIGSFALLASGRPASSGAAAGLLMGTRASYWPLLGSLLVLAFLGERSRRPRLLLGLAAGTLVWAVPFLATVGVGSFVKLGEAHLRGHFAWWGGSIGTRPDVVARAAAFTRDIFYDGLAPAAWALVAVGALAAAVAWVSLSPKTALPQAARTAASPWCGGPRSARFLGGGKVLLVALGPYAVWAFLAQNVIEQPRHALPLVEGLALALAGLFAASPLALGLACAALAGASLPLALERHRIGPAPAQAADWLLARETPADTAVMTDRSWRFFTELPGPFTVRQHAWLSEVVIDLTRFDRLPPNIFLTSEVDLHSGEGPRSPPPRRWSFEAGPTFCRDVRIDRAEPCLGLTKLTWSPR
ncbi:MAG: hypothetical protein ACYDCL_16530 [Myxococcales bacterium]